jgi:murein DD-endopeptidase MepM/ murein hydrolase activator NlpD
MNSSELDCVKFIIIMSSKAEKTSYHSHQQPRLSIFFRNPLLLKIVAWLGSLSFIGTTGVVWADLRPISTSQTEAQAIITASVPAPTDTIVVIPADRETYGPYLPIAQKQSPLRATPDSSAERLRQQLPNREVPIAVAPASASILPTGTILRPQHTDLLTADNYTVGVNGSASAQKTAEEFVNIPVPAPLSSTIPVRTQEIVTSTTSQVQPSYIKPPSVIGQSVPATSIQTKPRSAQSANGYRVVPAVVALPTLKSTSPRVGRSGISTPTPIEISTPNTSLAGLKPTIVTPMKSLTRTGRLVPSSAPTSTAAIASTPATPANSIDISVPAPRTQRIEIQPVTRLPQVTANKSVPTVPAIPTVRPAAVAVSPSSKPIAFVNPGNDEYRSELIYPLTTPAPTTSSFGWRTHPITGSRRFHSGIDIGAPMGAPIVAAGSGTIVSAGWLGGYGKTIVIQHNGVQQTLYGHLSEVFVQPGQRIEQGTVIGRVGSTGNSTGPHLHFETRVSTTDGWVAIDPGDDIKYAIDNLRRSMPFAQRTLEQGIN